MILTERNKSINWQTETQKHTKFPRLPKQIWINRHSPGFTLVELMTVAAILGVLATIALMASSYYVRKASNVVALTDINMLQKEIFNFGVGNSVLIPPDLDAINYAGYLDPWDRPYVYQSDLTIAPRTKAGNPINTYYDLYSKGKDGQTAQDLNNPLSRDDIISAGDGAYRGLGEDY
jgi:general secretion pathway protein G